MSATPVNSVKFTKAQYTATNKKEINVTDKKEVGTVIYVESKDNAYICNSQNGDLEYKKTANLFTLPQSHGLTIGMYYVVINENPCDTDNNAKKFFECTLTQKNSREELNSMPVKNINKRFTTAEEQRRETSIQVAAPSSAAQPAAAPAASSVAVASTNDSMTIYKIEGNKVVSRADVKLSDIRNAHIAKQKNILDNREINNKITGLYTWVDTNSIINDDMDSYNKYYNSFMTEVGNIIKNNEIEVIIRKNRGNNKIINDMLVNGNAFTFNMSKIFNMLKDKNKFKFIFYEIINNIFNILALQKNEDATKVIHNISKLKKSNIYENYFTRGDNPTYYMIGIDNAIKEELNLDDNSFTRLTESTHVSKGETAKIYGGSRKTKKRNQILKKQSRKTKKQSRK